MQNIKRQGAVAYGSDSQFNTNSSYVIWHNVRDYGATGEFFCRFPFSRFFASSAESVYYRYMCISPEHAL